MAEERKLTGFNDMNGTPIHYLDDVRYLGDVYTVYESSALKQPSIIARDGSVGLLRLVYGFCEVIEKES